MPPWALHGFDVLGLCDRRTEAVWGPKGPNEFDVVDERVLPWKIESVDMHSARLKDLAVLMKPLKGLI